MAECVLVIYADDDATRLASVSGALTSAGFQVLSLPGNQPLLRKCERPQVVVLCDMLHQDLQPIAHALWPKVPILVLKDTDDLSSLATRIWSALRSCG